jgi:HPr kinase/phosphorylase
MQNMKELVSVGYFLQTGMDNLGMELIAGAAGIDRKIIEPTINRPGLALTGFFPHFANKRIQVIGFAEHAYLTSLRREERMKRIDKFFAARIPCVVITRNQTVFPDIVAIAEKYGIPVLRTRMVTKHFVNAATILLENLNAPRMKVQGTMVEIMGIGVLIEGKPGMGKSEAALGIIKRGHALVSDDITALRLDSAGNIIGAPVNITRYHMEIRGLGIIHVPSLFGVSSVREDKVLDLVVTLCKPGTKDEDDRGGERKYHKLLLGVKVPQIFVPVAPGRDLANVIETAALDQKLRRLGHDAAKELDAKLVSFLSGGKDGSE